MREQFYYDQNDPMMGTVVIHEINDFRGGVEAAEYEWQGGPKMIISGMILEEIIGKKGDTEMLLERARKKRNASKVLLPDDFIGYRFQLGPYKLAVIDTEGGIISNLFMCIRADYPFWRLHAWGSRALIPLRLAWSRMILTAVVWRLADYDPAAVPSIQNLHAVKWIKRVLHGD